MKFKWFLVLVLISLSLASACSQAVPPPPVNRKTPLFENAIQARNRVDTIAAAKAYLALQTGLDPQDIQFLHTNLPRGIICASIIPVHRKSARRTVFPVIKFSSW